MEGLNDGFVNKLSRAAMRRVGNSIGHAAEARFVGNGRYVLILDRFSPHLRLFSERGDSLWAGGREGGGPMELRDPQAIATRGDTVLVFQQGRISEWSMEADSLAWRTSRYVAPQYFPLGIEFGCDGNLLLYARNDRQFEVPRDSFAAVPQITYLHAATAEPDSYDIKPLWGTPRNPDAIPWLGHSGVLINRADSNLVVLHRSWNRKAGEIMQFDCGGHPVRHYSENSLVTGDTVPVLEPRRTALEWMAGVVALPDGFVIPVQRYLSKARERAGEPLWKTEIFLFLHGQRVGSVLIARQWTFMDYDAGTGVLMTTDQPVPHFVILPEGLFRAEAKGGTGH
jgi:hypothetical protein